MSDAVAQVKALTEKRDKAKVALTRLQTQREALEERRTQLEAQLKADYGIAPGEADALILELSTSRDALIVEAEASLSKVNL